jgi:hypothetical protein
MAESGNIDKASKEAAKSTKETAEHAETLSENLARSGERLKEISAEATESGNALRDMAKSMKESAKDGGDFSNAISFGAGLATKLSKTSESIAKFTKENLGASKDTEKVLRRQKVVRSQIQEVESQIKFLQDAKANASKAERIEISKTVKKLTDSVGVAEDLLDNMQEIAEANEKLNDSTAWLDGISDLVGDIPVVGKMFGEFSSAAKQARKDGVEGGDALKAGAGALAKSASKLMLAFAAKTVVEGMYEGSQRATDLSRNLNLSEEAAYDLNNEFNRLGAKVPGLIGKDFFDATMAMSDTMGATADLSFESAKNFGAMTKKMGLSAETAATLTKLTGVISENGQGSVNTIVGQVAALNDAEGTAIRYQDVMKDIAGAGASQQLSISKQPGGLAKAAFQARKLGLNFAQLESSANSLLDFENSISAELEAELLTGKQLNLETARMAALRGDDAVLAEELAKNLGTAEEFASMGRLQQEKLAAAFGMSKDEAAQMLMNQEALSKFGAKDLAGLQKKAKEELKRADLLEKEGKIEDANLLRAKVFEKLGDSEITRQLKNSSAAEKQKEAMAAMVEAAQALSLALTPITWMFSKIAGAGGETLGFVTKIGVKLSTMGKILTKTLEPATKLLNFLPKQAIKYFEKITKFLGGGMLKGAAKTGGKTLLKKIPVIGLIVGAGLAISRASKGDWWGALAEVGSGVASLFPGIGTGISAAIDVGLMASDAGGLTGGNPNAEKAAAAKKKQASGLTDDVAADFISRPGQPIQKFRKDDIILGATNPLGGSGNNEAITLLKEIALAIKQGGDVYMDGNKVGQSLMLASSKMS